MAWTTDLLFLEANAAPVWTVATLLLETSLDPAPAADGDSPPYELAWRYRVGTPSVAFECSTGGSEDLCEAESIVIAQSESATQTITITMRDEDFRWHPEGDGEHFDVMVDGAEVDLTVTVGGVAERFFATFKPAGVSRGGDNIPVLTWVGTCEGDKLGKCKKTFETIAPNASAVAYTQKQVLDEMVAAVGISGDWTRIPIRRLGTPFHRQQLLPGDIFQKMLELTVDEWRTDYRTVMAYDPESGGRRWEYDVETFTNGYRQIVFEHQITPQNNDPIDKVIVLRAVAAGPAIPNSEQNQALRLLEFGEGQVVNFDPPASIINYRYNARDYRAKGSYFLYYSGDTLVAAREVLNPLDYSESIRRAPIWNCTRVSFTWGAASPDVDADLTQAEGEIIFYGRSVPQSTVGEGETANAPLDTTTRVVRGSGTNEIELPPNPLFYNAADMQYFGDKYLRRVGRQQVEHTFKLPLNPSIKLGDTIAIKRDGLLGGSGFIEVRVVAYSHSISAFPEQCFSNVTGVKYAA